jgi:hypothetical protein
VKITFLTLLNHQYGAPNSLFNDNAKSQIGKAVHEILRMYTIKDFQCEPHHQYQNLTERRIEDAKKLSNTLLDRTGAQTLLWLLCVQYVVYLLNSLSTESLQWKTPVEAATGQRPDITASWLFTGMNLCISNNTSLLAPTPLSHLTPKNV